ESLKPVAGEGLQILRSGAIEKRNTASVLIFDFIQIYSYHACTCQDIMQTNSQRRICYPAEYFNLVNCIFLQDEIPS
ncbi:MAG: hypothetical protein WD530_04830, partial [Vicingaceae bacterium]